MIGLSVTLFTPATPIPGFPTLLPCAGAALVIWSGSAVRTSAGLILANPLMVGIGRISYSIYLWHWPALVYLPAVGLSYDKLTGPQIALYFIALLAVSAASYLLIEQPFRRGQGLRLISRPVALGAAVGGLSILCIASIATGGFAFRLSPQQQAAYNTTEVS